jgi:hypothetical protein
MMGERHPIGENCHQISPFKTPSLASPKIHNPSTIYGAASVGKKLTRVSRNLYIQTVGKSPMP